MKKLAVILLIALPVFGFLWLREPAFDTEPLEEVLEIFENKTRSMQQGRFNYPLPRLDDGQDEVEYLQDLAQLLAETGVDCQRAGREIEKRSQKFLQRPRRSVFKHAAYLYLRRQGANLVQQTSQQIGDSPFSIKRRVRVVPLDADKQFEILKEKGDKIELVTQAQAALTKVIVSAGTFADECSGEAEGLKKALSYILAGLKR